MDYVLIYRTLCLLLQYNSVDEIFNSTALMFKLQVTIKG
jgi:hypothetical protein